MLVPRLFIHFHQLTHFILHLGSRDLGVLLRMLDRTMPQHLAD